MNITFRAATTADEIFFIHAHHEAYRPVITRMFGWDDAVQDEFARKSFDDGSMMIILHDHIPVGVFGLEDRADHLWLKEVFLLPAHQGQGIGSYILAHAIAQSAQTNKPLRLQTLKANLGAKRLYERHGFTVTDSTATHWQLARPL